LPANAIPEIYVVLVQKKIMNRRDFLLKSALAGSTIVVNPKTASYFGRSGNKPKSAIIIGAGFAGLAAGMQLKAEGVKVTILEARKRVGGRVLSNQPAKANGQVIELGAEWVGNSHERVIELCEEFGLTLENNQFETDLLLRGKYSKTGKWGFSPKMDKFWENKAAIWENMSESQRKKLDKTDWWRFLSQKGMSDSDLILRDLMDSTDFGESIRHTSAYAAFAEYAESSEKNEMDLKIKGGNSKLAEKMADNVGRENILLDHSVLSVKQSGSKMVTVTCSNGKTFDAEKMICAIPTFSLLKIDWQPGLPTVTQEALHELQYARIGKFPVVFSERFWKREDFDLLTDTPAHYFYHGTKNQTGKTGVLMCYATGDKADVLGSVNKTQRLDIILNALKPAFGNVRKYISEDLMYYWGHDQYSSGAYAFYGKGQLFEVMPILKKPFENVYFAGEHLADWQGFMEGAINSGEEAAMNCL
jgi:monoamine oxidase